MPILDIVLFVIGLVCLVTGAEALVRGASRLATAMGVSPLVTGLTVVAFGTSSPELAVSIHAGFTGNADVALGNVVGSNICNILLILGASAAITPIMVASQIVRFDVWVMIAGSVLLLLLGSDLRVSRLDGLLLFAGAVAYTAWLIRLARRGREAERSDEGSHLPAGHARWVFHIALVVVGLALLLVGARWLVNGAVTFALSLGVSELIVGLTIVAVGTSLPELATSVIAAARGERDIAVGNVVGSNIFNILVVLGLSAAVSSEGIAVARTALRFDLPVMLLVALLSLPILYTGYRVERCEGALFLGFYAAYLAYLILDSTRSAALTWYRWGVIGVAVPVLLYVGLETIRHFRKRQGTAG